MLMVAGTVAISAAATVIPVAPQLRGEGIFLPNLDDDARRCRVDPADLGLPGIEVDQRLAARNDAADEEVNGARDEADLTMVELVGAPTGEPARVKVDRGDKVRIFVRHHGRFRPILPGDGLITAEEVRAGAELAVEGRDIIRDPARWDGRVRLTVSMADRVLHKDLRVARAGAGAGALPGIPAGSGFRRADPGHPERDFPVRIRFRRTRPARAAGRPLGDGGDLDWGQFVQVVR
jgi:protein-arginine deiminase